MSENEKDLWSRLREARVVRMLAVYLAASWALLQVTDLFIDRFGVPEWVAPAALILLLVGLVVLFATAWVQSHPFTPRRAAAEEVPAGWELDVGDMAQSVARGRMPHLTWARAAAGGAVAFALLFGVAGLYVVIKDRGRSFAPGEAIAGGAAPGIAVLPFQTSGAGLDVWREGVIDLVSANLDGAAGLRAIDSRTVLARWGEAVEGDAVPDLELSLAIASEAGASYALLGKATALGPEVRLTADVYDVRNGEKLGQAQAQGAQDSVYALVDRLSMGVLQAILGGNADDLPRVALANATTPSLAALKAFLEGEIHYRRGDFEAAIPSYQRAIEADSTFALALTRLGNSYAWSESVDSDLFGEYVGRALRHADRLPPREAILVRAEHYLQQGTLDGIALLRDGVRKYPDDPEMWYQLADYYNHLGAQALVTKAEEREAFDRALALDPSFSPVYIHPIESAIGRADSAGATALLERYRRLARGSRTLAELETAFALAWGDDDARARAAAAIDTMPMQNISAMLGPLHHPRTLDVRATMLSRAQARAGAPGLFSAILAFDRLQQGRLRESRAALEHPALAQTMLVDDFLGYRHFGLTVADSAIDRAAAWTPADSLLDAKPFFVALWAAENGRWDEVQGAVARAEALASRYDAAGDSTGERFVRGMLRAMEGVAAWRRGRTEEAVTLLEVGQREATGFGSRNAVNIWLRLLLARIHLDEGRPREALRYLRSFPENSPLASLERGRAHEALGERDEARAQYEVFLEAWRGADREPSVQRLVADARAGLGRLGFRPRG